MCVMVLLDLAAGHNSDERAEHEIAHPVAAQVDPANGGKCGRGVEQRGHPPRLSRPPALHLARYHRRDGEVRRCVNRWERTILELLEAFERLEVCRVIGGHVRTGPAETAAHQCKEYRRHEYCLGAVK